MILCVHGRTRSVQKLHKPYTLSQRLRLCCSPLIKATHTRPTGHLNITKQSHDTFPHHVQSAEGWMKTANQKHVGKAAHTFKSNMKSQRPSRLIAHITTKYSSVLQIKLQCIITCCAGQMHELPEDQLVGLCSSSITFLCSLSS